MDQFQDLNTMIGQMPLPAFLAHDGVIAAVNQPAAQRTAAVGMAVADILVTGKEEYQQFQNGSLYLTICLGGTQYACSITQLQAHQLFTVEDDSPRTELQALALAAQQLCVPISEISLITERLSHIPEEERSKIKRNLYRLQRIIGNMSDAGQFVTAAPQMVTCELRALFMEVFDKAKTLLSHSGVDIHYQLPAQPVFSLAQPEMLKRAVYNLLSNAVKFTPAGKTIHIDLNRTDSRLYLSVSGSQFTESLHGSIFKRYTRQPGLEDPKSGIGLGMTLIHSAATAHGGTVLVAPTEDQGLKITMTLSIRKAKDNLVRSPVIIPDIYGGQDQALIELSDVLPYQLY